MELWQLRYFIMVAEELNYNRAAERLHITQSGLSQRIQELERELEVPLFERTSRRVRLTPSGKIFLENAYQILEKAEQAINKTRHFSKGLHGQLMIGITPSVVYTEILSQILKNFHQRYPEVELIFKEVLTREQKVLFEAEKLDIGFIIDNPIFDTLPYTKRPVVSENSVLVVPEHHPLASREKVSFRELAEENWVWSDPKLNLTLDNKIFRFFEQFGYSPKIIQVADNIHLTLALVATGLGIALANPSISAMGRKGIVYVPFEEETHFGTISVVWSQTNPSPVLKNLIEVIDEIIQARTEPAFTEPNQAQK